MKAEHMAEYRIDDLARAAGTTVRNVRVYQERGLLPPPRREGRVGIYSDAHLARLCLIGQMLERGHTFAGIAERIAAWQYGRDPQQALDLEEELTGPWSDELPEYFALGELLRLFGNQMTPELIQRAMDLGIGEWVGDRFRVPSPRLLRVGVELVNIGIAPAVVLDIFEEVRAEIEEIAPLMVRIAVDHVFSGREPGWLPRGEELSQLVILIHRLRPLAQTAVDVLVGQVMERQVHSVLSDRFARVLSESAAGQGGKSATRATPD
jgi:DNA-binding transcriptional MerR regulator